MDESSGRETGLPKLAVSGLVNVPVVAEWKARVRIALAKEVGEMLAKEVKARRAAAPARGADQEAKDVFEARLRAVFKN